MADIKQYTDKIRSAIYGKEVRSSLADGIEAINREVEDTTNDFNDLRIEAGNAIGDLNISITTAKENIINLNTQNTAADTNISSLDKANTAAATNIEDLNTQNVAATTNITNLDAENNEAVTNKNSLYTENSVAQMHLDELKKKTEVATNTKEELNQFINENKDMSKIHERINNNTKEITNLKDSIAQNRPIVIAEDTPIGSIVWYTSEKVLGKVDPDVWRVCNGQTLNKADFPELYDLIKDNPNYTKTATTFNLPDLISSKRFIRSVDEGYNVGVLENDELKSHRHFLVNSRGKFFEISGSSVIGATNNAVDTFFVSGATKPNKVGYTNEGEAWMYATCTNHVGGDETRPKNIQFIPLIKCKCRAKDIVDLATDVEQTKAGFNTLKEAMDSKATKESIREITEEISNAEEAILDIGKELEDARNGEVSLDTRIEKDINKINDNIDNLSFLPYEGENIDIDNSLNGYTRDLVIKGKTLHNLYIGNREKTFTLSQGQHYNYLPLCETSILKLDTPYTIYFDIEIISNTTSGSIGDNFSAELGVSNGLTDFDNHPTASKIYLTSISNTNKNIITFTNFKGYKYLAIRPLLPPVRPVPVGQQVSYKIKNIMILEGDYTNKSIPKYFEGIKSVGELEENKISILSTGKNLFNLTEDNIINNGVIVGDTVETTPHISPSIKFTNLKIGKIYTIYCKVKSKGTVPGSSLAWAIQSENHYYNGSDLIRVATGTQSEVKATFETPTNEVYLVGSTVGSIFSEIQLIEGEFIPDYEPYKDDKKDILLPFENGLKSLPNKVVDEFNKAAYGYKIIQRIGRKILDGTGNWEKSADTDKTNTLNFVASSFDSEIKSGSQLICNKFINKGTWGTDDESCAIETDNLKLRFRILKSKLESEDVAGFKKYLRDLYNNGDPVVIYYELAEPVVYELDKCVNLEVYKDKTYISSNNSIQPIISCKVPVDVQATISILRKNNKELEEENIKLKEISYKNEATNDIQQIDIDNNQMATVELFEMLIGGINTLKLKGGDNGMVEVYVSLILKGKKTLDEVPSIIRPKVEAMLKDLEVEL